MQQDIGKSGGISQGTFLRIWKREKAIRAIGFVFLGQYESLYAPALECAAFPSPERKLEKLKLPGTGAPSGSTAMRLMCPDTMPIIDIRTATALQTAHFVKTHQTDFAHYETFRSAVNGIRCRCPG